MTAIDYARPDTPWTAPPAWRAVAAIGALLSLACLGWVAVESYGIVQSWPHNVLCGTGRDGIRYSVGDLYLPVIAGWVLCAPSTLTRPTLRVARTSAVSSTSVWVILMLTLGFRF